jgi:hypothetical protein
MPTRSISEKAAIDAEIAETQARVGELEAARASKADEIDEIDARLALKKKRLDELMKSRGPSMSITIDPAIFDRSSRSWPRGKKSVASAVAFTLSTALGDLSADEIYVRVREMHQRGELDREPKKTTVQSVLSREKSERGWESVGAGAGTKWRTKAIASANGSTKETANARN